MKARSFVSAVLFVFVALLVIKCHAQSHNNVLDVIDSDLPDNLKFIQGTWVTKDNREKFVIENDSISLYYSDNGKDSEMGKAKLDLKCLLELRAMSGDIGLYHCFVRKGNVFVGYVAVTDTTIIKEFAREGSNDYTPEPIYPKSAKEIKEPIIHSLNIAIHNKWTANPEKYNNLGIFSSCGSIFMDIYRIGPKIKCNIKVFKEEHVGLYSERGLLIDKWTLLSEFDLANLQNILASSNIYAQNPYINNNHMVNPNYGAKIKAKYMSGEDLHVDGLFEIPFTEEECFKMVNLMKDIVERNYEDYNLELDNEKARIVRVGNGKKNLVVVPGLSLLMPENLGKAIGNQYKALLDEYTIYVINRRTNYSEDYTVEKMTDDLFECMKKLSIKKADFFGASQGGMICMLMAIKYPEYVGKVVACSTAARLDEKSKKVMTDLEKAATNGDKNLVIRLFVKYVFGEGFYEQLKPAFDEMEEKATDCDMRNFAIGAKACIDFDIFNDLVKIKSPLLVVGSDNDAVFSQDAVLKEISEKTNCFTYMYKGFNHAVYDTNPDFVVRLKEFLLK